MSKKKKRTFGGASEDAERRSSGANYGHIKLPKDVRMFIPENECVVTLDILPYEITDSEHIDRKEQGDAWYKRPYKLHRSIGPNKDSYVCPTTFGNPCPICERMEELKENYDENKKEIGSLKPQVKDLYAVKVKEYEGSKSKFDKKIIHLFDFSDYNFQEVFVSQLKKKEGFDSFFDPENGKSLEITFDEDTFEKSKFAKATRVDFVERKKQYSEDIIDEVPKLDECLTVLSYDDLEAKFYGDVAEDKKDKKEKKNKEVKEEGKEEPKKEKKVKKGKKSKEEEPEKEEKKDKKNKKEKESEKSDKKEKKDKKDKSKELTCPHNHKFAKDCDKFDDCEDCELWNECKTAKKELKKKK